MKKRINTKRKRAVEIINSASEHDIQSAFFDYLAVKHPKLPAFAIPNQGKRSYGAYRYFVKEGFRAGVPDVFIAKHNIMFAGLFIEFKTLNGKRTEKQIEWGEKLNKAGYIVTTCYDLNTAIQELEAYLLIDDDLKDIDYE